MCLKTCFDHYKWFLRMVLSQTVFKTVFLLVDILTLLFSLTVPNLVMFFHVIG